MNASLQPIVIQPRDLLEIVSRIGAGRKNNLGDSRLNTLMRAVRRNPHHPLTLRCTVSGTFDYQNPRNSKRKSKNDLFTIRCNLKILQMLGLAPGDTRPALDLFRRVLQNIPTARDILWFDSITSQTWKGISRSKCHYAKGRAMGIEAIIPLRQPAEKARSKKESANAMYRAGMLRIRPSHLMCMACFYGKQFDQGPIPEDNLFEAIEIIHRNPNIPIELIEGPCMICNPCTEFHARSHKCLGSQGMSLRDELKDLQVLQQLGLKYGDVVPARALFKLLFRRIQTTRTICGFDGVVRGPEWTVCRDPQGSPDYVKGRAKGLGLFKRRPNA